MNLHDPKATRPSTLRVYQFRHQRVERAIVAGSNAPPMTTFRRDCRVPRCGGLLSRRSKLRSQPGLRTRTRGRLIRRTQRIATKNGRVDGLSDVESEGIGVRVLVGGAWGFACDRRLSTEGARDAATRACAFAARRAREPTAAPSRRSSRARARTARPSRSTPSTSRSPTRSRSACAPTRRSRAPRVKVTAGVRPGAARAEGAASPPTGRRSSRSSSSAAAASTRPRPTRRAIQIAQLPEQPRRLERTGRLGVRPRPPARGRGAPRRRAGGRAAPRRPVPRRRDDGRHRRRADAAAGARVGGPPDRARPRLRHRGRLRRHELPRSPPTSARCATARS